MSPSSTPSLSSDALESSDQASASSDLESAQQLAYEMAYGLSHELNNPLANIAARARLLAEQEGDPQKRLMLAAIVDQAMRGCEMIADLMQFARPPAIQSETINFADVVELLCRRLEPWCEARRIRLTLDKPTSLHALRVQGDRAALTEALWAIARNSIEVAQQEIILTIDETSIGEVALHIVDDGPGLSPAALEKAFHPYFSGREAGRGLGLGLSKARRFLQLMHGNVTLRNQDTGGCEALVTLPIH